MAASSLPSSSSSSIFSAKPAAVFLTKFENTCERSDRIYQDHIKQNNTLVACIKNSGSLWLCAVEDGEFIFTSKNGVGNPYASAGLYIFVQQFQKQWGVEWKAKMDEFMQYLQVNNLSLGCECVSSALGAHGEHPLVDHIIVNAVIDRRSLLAYGPLVLVELQRRFRLLTSGFYVFRNGQKFLDLYNNRRQKIDATFEELHAELLTLCDSVHLSNYELFQGSLLEGFVSYFVKENSLSDADLDTIRNTPPLSPNGAVDIQPLSASEMLPPLSSILVLGEEADENDAATGGAAPAPARDLAWEKVSPLMPTARMYSRPPKSEQSQILTSFQKMAPNNETTAGFAKMLQVLNELKIKYECKLSHPIGSTTADQFVTCVHIFHDESFFRYERFRQANPSLSPPLPFLLRGNFWILKTKKEGGGGGEEKMEDEGDAVLTSCLTSSPLPDSIWKFKLLAYTSRTFLFRNAGGVYLKTNDPLKFENNVFSFLRFARIESPSQVKNLTRVMEDWRAFLAGLNATQKKQFENDYLPFFHQFVTERGGVANALQGGGGAAGGGGGEERAVQGLVLCIAPSPQYKQVAQQLARVVAGEGAQVASVTTNEKELALLEKRGSVLFADVFDPLLNRMIRTTFEKAGIQRVTVCQIDVSTERFVEFNPAASQGEIKKFGGMCHGLATALARFDRFALERGVGEGLENFAANLGGNETVKNIIAACTSEKEVELTPLTCVMFVSIPGIGKNAILHQLLALPDFEEVSGFERSRVVALEKDVLNEGMAKAMSDAVANTNVSLLLLNRNCPPNSWSGLISEIEKLGRKFQRKVTYVAVLPESVPYLEQVHHFFSLTDLMVFYSAVVDRPSHPTNLCGEQPAVEAVFSLFARLFAADRTDMIDSVHDRLSKNTVFVPLLKSDLSDADKEIITPDMVSAMQELLDTEFDKMKKDDTRIAFQNKFRSIFTAEKRAALRSLRLPLEEIAETLALRLKLVTTNAQSGAAPCAGKRPFLSYVAVDLETRDVDQILTKFETEFVDLQPKPRRSASHVTLWFPRTKSSRRASDGGGGGKRRGGSASPRAEKEQEEGEERGGGGGGVAAVVDESASSGGDVVTPGMTVTAAQVPSEWKAVLHKSVVCRVVAIAEDENARALVIDEIKTTDDNKDVVVSTINDTAHVTVWTAPSVANVYSNEMLRTAKRRRLQNPEFLHGKIEILES